MPDLLSLRGPAGINRPHDFFSPAHAIRDCADRCREPRHIRHLKVPLLRFRVVGCFEFLLLLVNLKAVLAASAFVSVSVLRYCAVLPLVPLGAHLVSGNIAQITLATRAEQHLGLRTGKISHSASFYAAGRGAFLQRGQGAGRFPSRPRG
jgi:hypothetical protein